METSAPAQDAIERIALACRELAVPVVVVTTGADGISRCLAVNPAYTERFAPGDGVVDDVVGRPVAEVLPGRHGLGSDGVGAAESGLAEANRHLRAENRELTRSNLDLNEFAYVASHDLVEPLRMVTSYLDLLSARYGDALDEQGKRYVGFAIDGATRMRALIDDLLTLARVSSCEGRVEDVELGELIDSVTADLRMRIQECDATVRTGPLPVVRGDAGQLKHALTNLVANAVRFRRPDVAPVVEVTAERTDGGWRIAVVDNGIGIKPEFRGQVFDMFRRLHPRSAYAGTGMGLAIAKKVVERHGGEIGVDAGPDGGSAFWFTLPDAPAPPQPQHHHPEMRNHAS